MDSFLYFYFLKAEFYIEGAFCAAFLADGAVKLAAGGCDGVIACRRDCVSQIVDEGLSRMLVGAAFFKHGGVDDLKTEVSHALRQQGAGKIYPFLGRLYFGILLVYQAVHGAA